MSSHEPSQLIKPSRNINDDDVLKFLVTNKANHFYLYNRWNLRREQITSTALMIDCLHHLPFFKLPKHSSAQMGTPR